MDSLPLLQIRSSRATYTVAFSDRTDLSGWCPEADALLVDSFFRDRLFFPASVPVIWVEASESAKDIDAIAPIFVALRDAGFSRGSHLTAIGGGVVQDIATFVASLYMRGIAWNYVPTTLLGMADSCLGGKSSINVGPYKNLIGNFHPPCQIDILPVFARTLPLSDLAGGIAEAAKIAYCRGATSFLTYQRLIGPFLDGNWQEQHLIDLLHSTHKVKQWFIETDEFDRSERRLLNFGHTWGHALESATSYAIPHGLAVAIGMMASISFVGEPQYQTSASSLWNHCIALLRHVIDQNQLSSFSPQLFITAFQADKKHTDGCYHLIVPDHAMNADLGVKEITIPSDSSSMSRILLAMTHALEALSRQLLSSLNTTPDSL